MTIVLAQKTKLFAKRSLRAHDVGKNWIDKRCTSWKGQIKEIGAARAPIQSTQLRQRGDLIGMAQQSVGKKVARFKQPQNERYGSSVPNYFGIPLRTSECRA